MKRFRVPMAVVWLLMLDLHPASAQQPPSFHSREITVKAGQPIYLVSEGKGDGEWDVNPFEFDDASTRQLYTKAGAAYKSTLVTYTAKPGKYLIKCILWDERKIERFMVTVDGPGPTPPPDPTPIPPAPDQFAKDLAAAYALEGATEGITKLNALIQICRDISVRPVAGTDTIKTVRDVYVASVLAKVSPSYARTRGVIVRYLDKNLPTTDGPITAAVWNQLNVVFTHVAKSLEALR